MSGCQPAPCEPHIPQESATHPARQFWENVKVSIETLRKFLPALLLAQACTPTEHGPRILASGGRSSLEEVVLEAPWKRLATLGPGYGAPSFFIHSDFLSFFFSCSEDASQPRSGTSTARTRSANPEEYLEGGRSLKRAFARRDGRRLFSGGGVLRKKGPRLLSG